MFIAPSFAERRSFSSTFGRCVFGAALAALVLGGLPNAYAVVVIDDFSDGTDGSTQTPLNPTSSPSSPANVTGPVWTRLDGAVQSTGQVWDASTGQYRLYAPANGMPTHYPQLSGLGYVGSYVGPSFADVRAEADFVDFPNSNFESDAFFGIAARLNGDNDYPEPPPPTGTGFQVAGYAYQYEPEAGAPFPNDGELVLTYFYAGGFKDLGSQRVHLDSAKDYRLVLEVVGHTLHGQAFEITTGGVLVPVAERWRNMDADPVFIDDDGNPVTPQVPAPFLESGFSGVYGLGNISEADFTIDNFRTETLVAGDYNRNGVADAADYVVWRKTVGQMGPIGNPVTSFGNMQANGVSVNAYTQTIDDADYNFWKANFGESVGGGEGFGNGGVVPEPASAMLVLVGLIGTWLGRRSPGR